MRVRYGVALLLGVSLVLSACGPNDGTPGATPSNSRSATAAAQNIATGAAPKIRQPQEAWRQDLPSDYAGAIQSLPNGNVATSQCNAGASSWVSLHATSGKLIDPSPPLSDNAACTLGWTSGPANRLLLPSYEAPLRYGLDQNGKAPWPKGGGQTPANCQGNAETAVVGQAVAGADGNFYVLLRCTEALHLVGYEPAAGKTILDTVVQTTTDQITMGLWADVNGLVVRNGNVFTHVTYGGQQIDQYQASNPGDSIVVNSLGTVYLTEVKRCGGAKFTARLVRYGIDGSTQTWPIGDCTDALALHELADGGVIVQTRIGKDEQLAAYNAQLHETWRRTIAVPTSDGLSLNAFVQADAYNRVVVRTESVASGMFHTHVWVLDGTNGQQLAEFEASASGDGYAAAHLTALASNRLYMVLGKQLIAEDLPGLAPDDIHGVLFNPVPFPHRDRYNWVAGGDSYSSGEGDPGFDPSTDIKNQNMCHRSNTAYAHRLQDAMSQSLNLTAFVACSSATTDKLFNPQYPKQPPQLNAMKPTTDVVTLSIGGNDADFAGFAQLCVVADCMQAEQAFLQKADELPGKLDKSIKAIRQRIGYDGKIFVVGYPQLVPNGQVCTVFDWSNALHGMEASQDFDRLQLISSILAEVAAQLGENTQHLAEVLSKGTITFSRLEVEAARTMVDRIDVQLQRAVKRAGANVVYVNPEKQFEGHELCTQHADKSQIYFNNLRLPEAYSFHPTKEGQQAYAEAVKESMSANGI